MLNLTGRDESSVLFQSLDDVFVSVLDVLSLEICDRIHKLADLV